MILPQGQVQIQLPDQMHCNCCRNSVSNAGFHAAVVANRSESRTVSPDLEFEPISASLITGWWRQTVPAIPNLCKQKRTPFLFLSVALFVEGLGSRTAHHRAQGAGGEHDAGLRLCEERNFGVRDHSRQRHGDDHPQADLDLRQKQFASHKHSFEHVFNCLGGRRRLCCFHAWLSSNLLGRPLRFMQLWVEVCFVGGQLLQLCC